LGSTSTKRTLLSPISDPSARALVRLQSNHINPTLVSAIYRYPQAQGTTAKIAGENEFKVAIETLVGLFECADIDVGGIGLWKEGGELGWLDVMVPVRHYHSHRLMPEGARLGAWPKRLFEHRVQYTRSTYELDRYERRVPLRNTFNGPNTRQVANAINTGRGLPRASTLVLTSSGMKLSVMCTVLSS
ncbi:hypothetical protein EV363DRAFT_1182091, partial [Boletus edulis]